MYLIKQLLPPKLSRVHQQCYQLWFRWLKLPKCFTFQRYSVVKNRNDSNSNCTRQIDVSHIFTKKTTNQSFTSNELLEKKKTIVHGTNSPPFQNLKRSNLAQECGKEEAKFDFSFSPRQNFSFRTLHNYDKAYE